MPLRGLVLAVVLAATVLAADAPTLDLFLQAGQTNEPASKAALREIAASWKNSWTPMIIDIARLLPPLPGTGAAAEPALTSPGDSGRNSPDSGDPPGAGLRTDPSLTAGRALNPGQMARQRLTQFLEKQTKQKFGDDLARWRRWMWTQPYQPHPDYARLKATLYAAIDPRMAQFFQPDMKATIRLDEIDWGGVKVNGIPPLVYPKTIPASEASWLKDNNVVFGIYVDGEARAYPKRILAWHEMARDKVGGVELTVVYCTLCGTVLPYESVAGGKHRVLGTSSLLYRSNKLMFDEETNSLWSTLEGKPVAGALTGSGLELKLRSSVTTTWKEWRQLHPDTRVLSLDTGFKRDYSEGAAYRDYFGTDKIMFEVPSLDSRLKNKAEVLVTLLPQPLAIATDFLRKHPVYPLRAGDRSLVVVTTPDGANRIYDTGAVQFPEGGNAARVTDATGAEWKFAEDALTNEGRRLARVAANRAFWFGWYAQFPQTQLVK